MGSEETSAGENGPGAGTADCRLPTAHFSLYIHIPYCVAKCPYCDFNSHAASRWPERDYTDALVAELEHYASQDAWRGRHLQTVFFGGGTPSLFAPESIARILDTTRRLWPAEVSSVACRGHVDVREPNAVPTADGRLPTAHFLREQTAHRPLPTAHFPAEITLEANPGTVTVDKLAGFRTAGVTRMSFGVQSFQPRHLAQLGRIHSGGEAVDAVRAARAAGFDNVNIDLMFAVPGQTLDEWENDLAKAIALGTEHISAYNLTYEEGTAFHALRAKGALIPQSEEIELAMFTRTQERLRAAGFQQYEISNYARPSHACRHNLNYWRGGPYLGVGAGAHSFVWNGSGRRWSNEKSPAGYLASVRRDGHARVAEETLTEHQARGEFVFLGLRCLDGLDTRAFSDRFGVEFLEAFPHTETLRRQGLLTADDGAWRLSVRGLHVADGIFATYL